VNVDNKDRIKINPGVQWLLTLGLLVFSVALAAFTALQYRMDPHFFSVYGLNHPAITDYSLRLLGHQLRPLNPSVYRQFFIIFLASLWLAYASFAIAGLRGAVIKLRLIVLLSVVAAVGLCVLCPPSFSTDVYTSSFYGRAHGMYGISPYIGGLPRMVPHQDPICHFRVSDGPSPYGPLWTVITDLSARFPGCFGVYWQVVALKLMCAMSLIGAAFAGRKVADVLSPGYGDLAFLAIGLNPLFLIEGPGNGHNDILMMFLLLSSVYLFMKGRNWQAGLVFSLALGVKFIPIILLPWLIMRFGRGKSVQETVARSGVILAVSILPVLAAYFLFWQPTMFVGLTGRLHGMGGSAVPHHGDFATHAMPIIAIYAALTYYVRGSKDSWAWFTSSAVLLLALQYFVPDPFPWYFAWSWVLSLACWNKTSRILSAINFAFAFGAMIYYAF
jgi:hypothetical protein